MTKAYHSIVEKLRRTQEQSLPETGHGYEGDGLSGDASPSFFDKEQLHNDQEDFGGEYDHNLQPSHDLVSTISHDQDQELLASILHRRPSDDVLAKKVSRDAAELGTGSIKKPPLTPLKNTAAQKSFTPVYETSWSSTFADSALGSSTEAAEDFSDSDFGGDGSKPVVLNNVDINVPVHFKEGIISEFANILYEFYCQFDGSRYACRKTTITAQFVADSLRDFSYQLGKANKHGFYRNIVLIIRLYRM